MKHKSLIVAGEKVEIAWKETQNTVEATVSGRSYRIEKRKLGSGAFWFDCSGISVEVALTPRDQGYEVSIHGRKIPVEFADAAKARRRQSGADTTGVVDVRAPMPGKIVRVLLQKGDEVEPHQGIVVMEAMKMQNEIRSPKRGRIVELKVSAGDAVNLADVVARVE